MVDRIAQTEAAMQKEDDFFDPVLIRLVQQQIDVEVWLNSKIGVYVYNRAVKEMRENNAIILSCPDLTDDRAQQAHEEIQVVSKMLAWLNQAIEDGHMAQEQLENEHGETAEIDESGGLPDEY